MNVTVVVLDSVNPSVEADKIIGAATEDLTVNVAVPEGEDVADAGAIVTPTEGLAVRETVFPGIGLE